VTIIVVKTLLSITLGPKSLQKREFKGGSSHERIILAIGKKYTKEDSPVT